MGGVSEIVTLYDLPYQTKAALCSYVPKLRKTYNATEIHDEHPICLTNQAATFDHSEDRHNEFTCGSHVPAGERTSGYRYGSIPTRSTDSISIPSFCDRLRKLSMMPKPDGSKSERTNSS